MNLNNEALADLLARIGELPSFDSRAPLTPTTKTCIGETPLHVAAVWGDLAAIKLLAEAGADLDAPGDYGWTPLHEAIGQNNTEAILLLIELGAKVTIANDHGQTAVDLAALIGNDDTKQVFHSRS